jgi:hypothetical protein
MRKQLKIGVIDLVAKGPTRALYARLMHANLASIMPQAIAAWCEEEGHVVRYACYTGVEDARQILTDTVDVVFISTFTEVAQLAYALSRYFRSMGSVTVIGGPHARCYPEDARKYFDYVLGLTDKVVLQNVLTDASPHRPEGLWLQAKRQPTSLPGVRERWRFIEQTLKKAPWIQVVPMLASFGCPYTCSFCIDSVIPYQPLETDSMKEDLRFLLTKFKRPLVAWHDPNFGVRFNETLDAIEEAVPPGRMDFIAESSLSLLSEDRIKRLNKNGFKAVLPGVESWFDLGNKSKTGKAQGMEKVKQVSEHVRMILTHIPYIQTNFVLGLDSDQGPEPFEMMKRFVDLTPGAFPGYSLLTAFGRAAPLNLRYQRDARVLPFPFHFLNNNGAMNVRPLHYAWPDFYDHVVDVVSHSFSAKAIAKRFCSTSMMGTKPMNVVRAVSSEGWGRLKYYRLIRRRLDADPEFRPYFEGESARLPRFYKDLIRRDLGPLWDWLPAGALEHDENAYSRSSELVSQE